MIGRNEVHFCPAQMCAIVQAWLNTNFVTRSTIADHVQSVHMRDGMFVFVLEQPAKSAAKDTE